MIAVDISKFAVLTNFQFVLYEGERAAQDYFVGSLRLDHVGGGILF